MHIFPQSENRSSFWRHLQSISLDGQPFSVLAVDKSKISIHQVDQCLPQTQCTLCGYPRCWDYAEAIVNDKAEINQCPPGGSITISELGKLLNRPKIALNEEHGVHEKKQVAWIWESDCIGCKLCIKACPVDCIVGANKLMHTVIAKQCTGCKLCVPVCPTDCIEMTSSVKFDGSQSSWPDFTVEQVERARRDVELNLDRKKQRKAKQSGKPITRNRRQLKRDILAAVQRKRATYNDRL